MLSCPKFSFSSIFLPLPLSLSSPPLCPLSLPRFPLPSLIYFFSVPFSLSFLPLPSPAFLFFLFPSLCRPLPALPGISRCLRPSAGGGSCVRTVPQRAAGRSGAAAPPVTSPSLLFPSLRRAAIRLRVRAAAAPQHRPRCRHAPGLRARPPAVSTARLHPRPPRLSQPLSAAVSGQLPRVSPLKGVTAPERSTRSRRGACAPPPARLSRRCWRSSGRAAAPAGGRGRSGGSSRVSERPKRSIAVARAAPAPVLGFGRVAAAPGFGLGTQLGFCRGLSDCGQLGLETQPGFP